MDQSSKPFPAQRKTEMGCLEGLREATNFAMASWTNFGGSFSKKRVSRVGNTSVTLSPTNSCMADAILGVELGDM